jgi:hypothetical protein
VPAGGSRGELGSVSEVGRAARVCPPEKSFHHNQTYRFRLFCFDGIIAFESVDQYTDSYISHFGFVTGNEEILKSVEQRCDCPNKNFVNYPLL